MPEPNIIPLQQPSGSWSRRWIKTKYANLIRYEPTGKYYAYAKVCGVKIQRSLKTKSLEVAKTRLDALLASERKRLAKEGAGDSSATFKALADDWQEQVQADAELKPRSKHYRVETLGMLRRTCTDLDSTPVKDMSEDRCKAWAATLKSKYSATRFNGCLQTLKAILALALERGLISENPAKAITQASVRVKSKVLPTDAKFKLLLKHLKARPDRYRAFLMIRFLVYSCRRIDHARQLLPSHVSLGRNTISWPPFKYEKRFQEVPMIPQLIPIVKELLSIHPGDDSPLMPIKNPRRALRTCCKLAGIPRLTNHDMRHLFTTKALESGVPVPDVALMRGDRDGGGMLLKTYSHPRLEHLRKVARRLRV